MEEWIVDRIEGELVVLERPDRTHEHLPITAFSTPVKEGDVVVFRQGSYAADPERTRERRERILKLQKKLFQK